MVTAIITVVGFLLGVVNSVTASIFNSTSGKAIKERLTKLRTQINNDYTLKNKLRAAYDARNIKLMNATLNTVPGGLASKVANIEAEVRDLLQKRIDQDIDKNINDNEKKFSKVESLQMNGYDNITNAVNTAEYNNNESKLRPTNLKDNYKNQTFTYKDQYGNTKTGDTNKLLTWAYGDDKSTSITTHNTAKPSTISTIRKVF